MSKHKMKWFALIFFILFLPGLNAHVLEVDWGDWRKQCFILYMPYEPRIRSCTKIIKHYPHDLKMVEAAYANRAEAYRSKAMDISCDISIQDITLGQCKLPVELYKQSIYDLGKAIGSNPNFYFHYFIRAMSYEEIGDYEKSIYDYSNSIERYKEHKPLELKLKDLIFLRRGEVYLKNNQINLAIADFNKVITMDPKTHFSTYSYRGESHRLMGDIRAAVADFEKAARKAAEVGWTADLEEHADYVREDPESFRGIAKSLPARGTEISDEDMWRHVKDSREAGKLRAYVFAFPNGRFVRQANNQIDKLK